MSHVDPAALSSRVRADIDEYKYEEVPAGTTVGVPWSREKVAKSIEALRENLVPPYPITILTGATEPELSSGKLSKTVWVVAEKSYIIYFDPETDEYGLADRQRHRPAPVFIGVTGDLVGVWGAQ